MYGKRLVKPPPSESYPGDFKLKDAFKDTWINFSHFVRLGDHDSFSLETATELLKRGAAMQTHDNHENQDIGIPLHVGSPDLGIDVKQTSIAQFQVKNVVSPRAVYANPTLAGKNDNLPVLSVVMQLGMDMSGTPPLYAIQSTPKVGQLPASNTRLSGRSRPTDISRRHYSIVLNGCTNATYSCVGEGSIYRTLLRADAKPFHEYPRADQERFCDAVYRLKPVLYNNNPSSFGWKN